MSTQKILRIDSHTHILPNNWPNFKEEFNYGGFIQLEHHVTGWARMMKDDNLIIKKAGNKLLDLKEEHPYDLPPDDKAIKEKLRNYIRESLRNWFKKEDWVRIDTQGNIAGKCGTMPKGKATQRCLPRAKAQSLTKAQRRATARKKVRGSKKGKQFVRNTKKARVRLKKK